MYHAAASTQMEVHFEFLSMVACASAVYSFAYLCIYCATVPRCHGATVPLCLTFAAYVVNQTQYPFPTLHQRHSLDAEKIQLKLV